LSACTFRLLECSKNTQRVLSAVSRARAVRRQFARRLCDQDLRVRARVNKKITQHMQRTVNAIDSQRATLSPCRTHTLLVTQSKRVTVRRVTFAVDDETYTSC
jgi:hypothetical protein